jgi:dTDP-glucose 4,6-dehydratase
LHANARYRFVQGDIGDRALIKQILATHEIGTVVNFAAESHVDRSIVGPEEFIRTNVLGTFLLLQEVRSYWEALPETCRSQFRFLHVSTDEVYGAPATASARTSRSCAQSARCSTSSHPGPAIERTSA